MATNKDRIKGTNPLAGRPSLSELTGSMVPGESSAEPEKQIEYVEVVPDDAIVPVDGGSFQYKRFALSPIGLTIPDDITQEEWLDVGQVLKQLETSIQWVVGDWAKYAHVIWGVGYDQIAEEFGYEVETLWTYASIANSIPTLIRNQGLSFSHHRFVAKLDGEKQRHWLERAASEGWTLSQMRKAMQGDPPTPLTDTDRFVRFLAENRRKYTQFEKKFKRVGQGEKNQISQMLDDEIGRLQELRRGIWEE